MEDIRLNHALTALKVMATIGVMVTVNGIGRLVRVNQHLLNVRQLNAFRIVIELERFLIDYKLDHTLTNQIFLIVR